MKVDYIVKCLEGTNLIIEENKRSGNNLATVLKLSNGCIFTAMTLGKLFIKEKM